MSARQMQALFKSKCCRCGGTIEKGQTFQYDKAAPKGQRATCAPCALGSEQAQQPQPQQQPAPVGAVEGVHILNTKPDYYRRHFDSVTAYVDYIAQQVDCMNIIGNKSRALSYRNDSRGREWLGVEDAAAVRHAMTHGWPEGVKRMREALDQMQQIPAPVNTRRRRVWTDQGDSVDIHRVNSGRLDVAWQRCQRRTSSAVRTVRLMANILDNCNAKASETFWRGAAVLKLADLLTEAGYSVEIAGAFSSVTYDDRRGNRMLDSITVKAASAPLDVDALAATLCLTGFARVYGFMGVISAADHFGRNVHGGLGQANTPLAKALRASEQGADLFITPNINNAATARAWVEEVIASMDVQSQRAA